MSRRKKEKKHSVIFEPNRNIGFGSKICMCTFSYGYICIHICTFASAYTYVHSHLHTHMYIHMCAYTYIHTHMRSAYTYCIHICTYTYVHTHCIYVCTYTYVHTHIYMHICTYTYAVFPSFRAPVWLSSLSPSLSLSIYV